MRVHHTYVDVRMYIIITRIRSHGTCKIKRPEVRNTVFFQAQATQRKRDNRITSLQLGDGTTSTDPDELKAEVLDFYHNLY